MKRLVVHVGKLVLYGLPPGKARGIGAAVERELARLAAEPGGPFAAPASDAARAVGSRLGQAIKGKIKP